MNINTIKESKNFIYPESNLVLHDFDQNRENQQLRVNNDRNIVKGFIYRNNKFNLDDKDNDNDDEIFQYNEDLDVPAKVTQTYKSEKGKLYLQVQFKQRSNGIYPNQKIFSTDYLRNKFPYFLIEFYETNMNCN